VSKVYSLADVKEALGWRELPSIAAWGKLPKIFHRNKFSSEVGYPFGPIGVGRTVLAGNQPLNGITSGSLPPSVAADIVSTDLLAAGQYQFDFLILTDAIVDTMAMDIRDQFNNTIRSFRLRNSSVQITSQWNTMNIPMAAGTKLVIRKEGATNGTPNAVICWSYLSAYRSNDPLSLAATRVQLTEQSTLGQTTQGPLSFQTSPSGGYSPPPDSGGDGGTGPSGGGEGEGGDF
jgi:hypothetical protein